MSAALVLSPTDRLSSARAFARSLNILLKHVRLYGLGHKRSAEQFDQAWKLLKAVISGQPSFLLGVSGNKLLLDGVPLECGPSEQTFAQMLAAAGISSIHFYNRITANDLQALVEAFANSRPSELLSALQNSVNESPTTGIRVNEVRFVAHDSSEGEGATIAGAITARAISQLGPEVTDWLKDPKKLLQLISAANGTHGGHGDGTGTNSTELEITPAYDNRPEPLKEDEVMSVLRFLSRMGELKEYSAAPPDSAVLQQELTELKGNAQSVLYQLLFSSAANSFDGQAEMPDLLKVAEHLAIKFAVEAFEKGEVKINAVQQMLERMNGELESLRRVLNAHEDKMSRAGMVVESHAELLDRQFWAAVPDWGKKNVLLSEDGWCIPPRNIRNYIEYLLERRDGQTAIGILVKYLDAVESKDPEARRKTATGIAELADLYGRADHGLLQQAILRVGRQLAKEDSLEIQTLLSAAFVHLNQEASQKRDYLALEQSLCSLARVEKTLPNIAHDIRPRISVNSRLRDFIAEIHQLQTLPQGLVDVLRRTPSAAAEEIAQQFAHCKTRQVADRYIELMERVGTPALQHLENMLTSRAGAEAVVGVGLLSRFNPQLLSDELPSRLSGWARQHQDSVVRQIASSGAVNRGALLLELLNQLDSLIVPEAIDEVGLSGESVPTTPLMELAAGLGVAAASPYVQLKAVEALGRLRAAGAETLLIELLQPRSLLQWAQPRELRVAAMQALQHINPDRATYLQRKSGLDDTELRIRPLDVADRNWVRQRRYTRVIPSGPISAATITAKGKFPVALERISLGGAFASRNGRGQTGSEALLEMQMGFRSIRSRVLIREAQTGMTFEIADIGLEDRGKLRKLIASQMK
ncbi:MAG TPA: hypothetical protein VG897_08855 [Terriglobales bacterium]|nr:hypothetical protein [Terriglobales bacterium]